MRYAICNEIFAGWDHPRVFATAADLGYAGVEIAPFTLAPLVTSFSAAARPAIRRAADAAGVRVTGLHWLLARTAGFHLTSPDPAVRRRTGDYLAALARCCADLGGEVLVFGSPAQRNRPPGVTRTAADGFALDTLGHCLPALSDTGVTLALEPLAAAETDYLNTAAEAVALLRRLGHPAVRLHLDMKAMAAEDRTPAGLVRAYAADLAHVHANDPNRRGPGSGTADHRPLLHALAEVGYAGWVSVEPFDIDPDPVTVARHAIEYLRACEV